MYNYLGSSEDTTKSENIKKLLARYNRNLQILRERVAHEGGPYRASISTLNDIEDTVATIEELETNLKGLESSNASDEEELRAQKQRVEIYLQGDFSLLTPERRSFIKDALAGMLKVAPQAIDIYSVSGGSIIFVLGIPVNIIKHFRSRLRANSAQLRLLKVEKVVLETESGETEEWVFEEGKFNLIASIPTIDIIDSFEGDHILKLLDSFAPKLLSENVRHLYDTAYKERLINPERAVELCQKALAVLEEPSRIALGDSDTKVYAQGRLHLLIASIFLDQAGLEELRKAEKHYIQSKDEFHSKQWSHLESLAYLGLAITRRKSGKFKEASDACEDAQYYIDHESVPSKINKNVLLEAIKEERATIQQSSLHVSSSTQPEEKGLPVYNISVGGVLIAAGGTTDLNFLSRKDYAQAAMISFEEVIVDLTKYQNTQRPNYILKVDENVDRANKDVDRGDWLFIKSEINPTTLNGKAVAALILEGNEIYVGLKTFVNAEDHYFLRARSRDAPSYVVTHYKSDLARINDYYTIDGKKVIQKRVYDVRVSGVVVDRIPEKSIENIVKAFVWRVPVVSDVAAGLDHPIAEENVIDYVKVRRNERQDTTYFGVVVVGDSMSNDGIYEGDVAVMQQQESVKNGDIAAAVITTPEMEALKVLKRYYADERRGIEHWFLKSSNPSAKHLVVTPYGTDTARLRKLYAKEIEQNKVILYENAELVIAGKFIQVVKKE